MRKDLIYGCLQRIYTVKITKNLGDLICTKEGCRVDRKRKIPEQICDYVMVAGGTNCQLFEGKLNDKLYNERGIILF